MATIGKILRVTANPEKDPVAFLNQLNLALSQISVALDQNSGLRSTVMVYQNLDLQGNILKFDGTEYLRRNTSSNRLEFWDPDIGLEGDWVEVGGLLTSSGSAVFTFPGWPNTGVFLWDPVEDWFSFSDDIFLASGESLYFRDRNTSITSSDAGHLDLNALTSIDLNAPANSPSFTSTVATGTAPYDCTSTTLNPNLNAGLLDGQHGSYYAVAGTGLLLDQTTPQTIINGVPLMTATVDGEGSDYQLANKAYVDLAVSSLELTEFLHNDASDIGGIYYLMDETEDAAGTIVSAAVPTGAAVNIFNFATASGKPHLLRLLAGVYDNHIHAQRSVSATRTVTLYYELYKRTDPGGVETLLGTSEVITITTTSTPYNPHLVLTADETLDVTDRIVVKWWATVTGAGGADPTVTFSTGGTNDSHFSLRINPIELTSIFVPYTGAEADVDLGTHTISAEQLTSTDDADIADKLTVNHIGEHTGAHNVVIDNDTYIGETTGGKNLTVNATLGAELAPAIQGALWTEGTGWSITEDVSMQHVGPDTGTIAPTSAITTVAGTTYKVVITISAKSLGSYASLYFTMGGRTQYLGGADSAPVTRTNYVTAISNANFILTCNTTSTCTITSISIKAMSQGDLEVQGELTILGQGLVLKGNTQASGSATYPSITFYNEGDYNYFKWLAGNEDLKVLLGSAVIQLWSAEGIQTYDDIPYLFGTGSDSKLIFSTTGNDSLQLGLKCNAAADSGYFSIMEYADVNNANRAPLAVSVNPVLRIYSSDATEALDYLEFYHNQTDAVIGWGNGSLRLRTATADTDLNIILEGTTNSCVLTLMEDEDYLKLSDDLLMDSTEAIYFRDTAISVRSSDDGHLDVEADTSLDFRINTVEQIQLTDGKLAPTTDNDIALGDSTHNYSNVYANGYNVGATPGIDTTFIDNDGNTITVTKGLITAKTPP